MDKYPFFVFVLCGVFLPRVLCVPRGNITIDCDSMLPHHGGEPQKSTPPYFIAVSFDKYDPGNKIKVTLKGISKHGFQGFQLQARELEGDTPVGSFNITDPNTQALACHNVSNSAVSHTNSEVKHKITTIWTAPSNTKSIQFSATFVQDSKNFWVGVLSKTITPRQSQSANVTERRNKKKIVIEVECTKKGGTYSSSGGCIQSGSSGSSQIGSSVGQVAVISPGGGRSGCDPGTYGIYRKYGCKDSVSSGSAVQKPVSFPDSHPYPPVRETFPSGGHRVNPCDRSSSSYNIVICKLGQSSSSQSSNTNGQGIQVIRPGIQVIPPGSQVIPPGSQVIPSGIQVIRPGSQVIPSGSQVIPPGSQLSGSSSSSVSTACGEGTSYDSNPCHQGSQTKSGSISSACDPGSSNCTGSKVIVPRDTSRALSRSSYNGQNESSSTNSSSANVEGGAFILFNNTSSDQGLPSGGKQSGEHNSAAKQSSPGLLLLFSVLSAFAISSSVVPK